MVRLARCIGLVAITALFWGCSTPQEPERAATPPAELTRSGLRSALDIALLDLLASNSRGAGPDFFMLPRSNDFDRIPQDPKNPLTPNKVHLGQLLYHETALGVGNVRPEGRETYACASCHFAQAGFGANLPQGVAEGGSGFGRAGERRSFVAEYDGNPHVPDCQPIRSPSILNTAYQELMLWNGQFGGVGGNLGTESRWGAGTPLESNFLGLHGLETQVHAGLGVHRMLDVEASRVARIPRYVRMFQAAFPADPSPVNRMNVALAVAAYERTVLASDAPFQKWLRGNRNAMTPAQKRGAIVFFGRGGCVDCHTGPALSSMTFYALGMNDLDGSYDARVNLAPFGGTIADNVRRGRGGFTGRAADDYQFKTPQLYNLIDSPFYGHGASFATVGEVVEYLNAGVPENPVVPTAQLALQFRPLGLSRDEVRDLIAFIEEGLYDPDLMRYVPKQLPSGNCFPVNDAQSRQNLGCDHGPVAAQKLQRQVPE